MASDHGSAAPSGSWSGDLLRGLLPLAIVAVSWWGYQTFGHKPPPATRVESGIAPEAVVTTVVQPFQESIAIRVEGIAKPHRYVKLASEVAGRVRFKAPECQEATFVKAGTLLFEIDRQDYELSVREATHQLEQSDATLKEWEVERQNTRARIELARQELVFAQRERERLAQLEDSRIATISQIDSAKRSELTAQNALLAEENRLRSLESQYERTVAQRDLQKVKLQKAERDLQRTKVTAPCDSTIVSEDVEQDGYVQVGTPLVVLNDVSKTEVQCNIEPEDMYWIWSGKGMLTDRQDPQAAYSFPATPVTIEFPFRDMICQWPGQMVRFAGTGIDIATRTIPCQVIVDQPLSGELRLHDNSLVTHLPPPPLTVGMFVTVVAQVTPPVPLLVLPSEALRPGDTVWTVEGGKLHIQAVRIARRLRDEVLVYADSDGIRAGQTVVLSPLPLPREGMAVQARQSL